MCPDSPERTLSFSRPRLGLPLICTCRRCLCFPCCRSYESGSPFRFRPCCPTLGYCLPLLVVQGIPRKLFVELRETGIKRLPVSVVVDEGHRPELLVAHAANRHKFELFAEQKISISSRLDAVVDDPVEHHISRVVFEQHEGFADVPHFSSHADLPLISSLMRCFSEVPSVDKCPMCFIFRTSALNFSVHFFNCLFSSSFASLLFVFTRASANCNAYSSAFTPSLVLTRFSFFWKILSL